MAERFRLEIPTSRYKTLKYIRKRPQFRRKAISEYRKIYALDSEATSRGTLLLLADNEGNYIDLEDITLENVLKFLFSKRYQNSWCFFWNLHYDARVILKMILLEISPKELLRFKQSFRCNIFGYSIHYIEKRKLSICKGHKSVIFFDISQFYFQKSLAEAYQKNIGKLAKQYLEMKNKRDEFTTDYYKRHKKEMRKYCIDDCIFTKELSVHWIDLFYKVFEFYPSHWISSGYLAEKILINRGINIPKFDEIPQEVQELAWNSYYGGRIELVERGHNKHCYIYDINSAYPYALTQIPDLTKGEWIHSKRLEQNALVGFFKIKAKIPETKHIAPFPFKVRSKIVYPVGEFITFVTLAELQSSDDSWYEILDSWQYVDSNPSYPFRNLIEEFYEQRKELQKAKNPLEQPIKIILNSIYGKTGQTTDNKIGNIFNPAIVSTITGIARASLYHAIVKNDMERDVIMMYTDSICTRKKLECNSEKLGEFKIDFENGTIYALQNGFYSKNGKWDRSRGIGSIGDESIEHKETFLDSKGRIKYSFKKLRVGTLKENLNKGTLDKIASFYEVTRELNINGDRGRHWWGRLTDARLQENNISSPFNLSIFDYRKI